MEIFTLRYECYSTGSYGKSKAGGVTLQFICETTHENYYVIFNANISRKRDIGRHKAGDPLPKGRFSVGYRSAFYKFWISTGLDIPPRLSAFNDYMGKLKQFKFSANLSKDNRLDACSLQVFIPNKSQTKFKQSPNNFQTIIPNKDLMEDYDLSGIEKSRSTCLSRYDISKQVSTNISSSIIPIHEPKRVQNQITEEWLDEYEKFSRDLEGLF